MAKLKFEQRRRRILMRGVKIGSKKDVSGRRTGMSIFEMTSKKYERPKPG